MTKKEMILKAATLFFAEKGYRDCSMAELAQAVGVAQGTIFYHYKTKEDLFLEILKKFREDLVHAYETHTQGHTYHNGLSMVEEVVTFYLHLAAEMEDRFLLLHRFAAYDLARTNDNFRDHLEAIYECLVDMFETAVRVGQQDGSVRLAPSRKLAMILFSMVDGVVRLHTYRLYDAGSLYRDLIECCHKVLTN